MKKHVKQVKKPQSADSAKLSLVIEKLEKKVSASPDAPGTCRRIYCI